jgi:hypothetical protein
LTGSAAKALAFIRVAAEKRTKRVCMTGSSTELIVDSPIILSMTLR